MLGFDDVRALAHAAEDVLASMRAAEAFPPSSRHRCYAATAALRAQINADGTAELVALPEGSGGVPGGPDRRGNPGERTRGSPAAALTLRRARPRPRARGGRGDGRTLRVPAGKIDHLLDVAA
jgi:hypothetical protein